ncbi:hypothetical protein ACE8DN_00900 [Xanthomonas perforans]|uniref:hypothetical protein n=1 Tax=Xanthomonas perforans TaxID=442694 RepID=UPI003B67E8E3
MKWPAFFRKHPDASLIIEESKQSPRRVLMDESEPLGGGLSTGILRPLVVRQPRNRRAHNNWRDLRSGWEKR